jgi:hypothetical protein
MGSWLEVNSELLNEVKAESVSEYKQVESGAYVVAIQAAYLRQTDSGAVMFELETITKDEVAINWSTCVKSGDAKGNKATYTDKKGVEKLLPGVEQVTRLFNACGFDSLGSIEPTPLKVIRRDAEIDAKVFKDLKAKKFMACVRQYENEYNGDINIKIDIEKFLDIDGKNKNGEYIADKFLALIEKSPIKLLKKKKEVTNTQASSEAAAAGW